MHLKRRFITVLHLFFSFLMAPAMLLQGCHRKGSRQFDNPAHYNLSKPYIIKLPAELNDVSGITYYVKDNSLFAESDEKGCLYKILLNKPTDIRKWKFSHKKDYEDMALADSTFYILNNNGDITSVNFTKDSPATHEFKFPENGKYEFESIYYDTTAKKLVLVCKDCEIDKDATIATYSFDPVQLVYGNSFSINAAGVADKLGPHAGKVKPSAAAINPATGELFILSSVNKVLMITDRNGTVKDFYALNPAVFTHPEGIAFSPSGSMFISNEADGLTPPQILYFQFKKSNDK